MASMTGPIRDERGMAAMIALMMIAMLLLIGLVALAASRFGGADSDRKLAELKTIYAAEAGLETATALIQSHYDSTDAVFAIVSDQLAVHEPVNGCSVSYKIEKGQYAYATDSTIRSAQSFQIRSVAVEPGRNLRIEVSAVFHTALRSATTEPNDCLMSSVGARVVIASVQGQRSARNAAIEKASRDTGARYYSDRTDGWVRVFEQTDWQLETTAPRIAAGNSDILP